MVWPIMGNACRRSIHLKDGVEASQRVRSSGRSARSSRLWHPLGVTSNPETIPGQKSASGKSPQKSARLRLTDSQPSVLSRSPILLDELLHTNGTQSCRKMPSRTGTFPLLPTSPFLGTNPAHEPITSGLLVI